VSFSGRKVYSSVESRIKREDAERAGSVSQFLNRRGRTNNNDNPTNPFTGGDHEYANVQFVSLSDPIIGIYAYLNVWSPYVAPSAHFSLSHIWAINVAADGLNLQTIEVAWI
jgi:hypothetical protein